MNNKKIILIIAIAIIVVAILILSNPFGKTESPFSVQNKPTSEKEQEKDKIPDFELEDFNGEKVSISGFAGKPIFIDFWAAWCPFCIDEMPEIEKIHKEFGPPEGELIVLGIHRSDTESIDKGTQFKKELGVTYTLLKDSTGEVYETLTEGRNFMPFALYIDRDGKIVKTKAGPKTAEEIREGIEVLLE